MEIILKYNIENIKSSFLFIANWKIIINFIKLMEHE
jgi:hypothetical protein